MKYILLTTLLILTLNSLKGQIPDSLSSLWSSPGLSTSVSWTDTINVSDLNFFSDSSAANDSLLNDLISTLSVPTIIYFPTGKYLFKNQISLASNILIKGSSSDSTMFYFDLGGSDNFLQGTGTLGTDTSSIFHTIRLNATSFKVNDAAAFSANDYAIILFDDSNLVTDTWAYKSVGQIVEIASISLDSIFIKSSVRLHIGNSKLPYLQKISPLKNIGIECVRLERIDTTSFQTSNIAFSYVVNSWIRGIESYKTNYSHIELAKSADIEISNNYFHESLSHGDGGRGYGIALQYSTSECLIENNIFRRLRHSMLVQAGANGNVFGYNYSLIPYWTDVALPSNSAGEIVCHGNYPFSNLWEGNIVDNIIVDDAHGINGPYNAFLRNRADGYGYTMNNAPATDNQIIVGNEITNTGFFMGLYLPAGTGHIEAGNNVKGTVTPAGTTVTDASYYLSAKPSFFDSTAIWPGIGFPNVISTESIPAKTRYSLGAFTICDYLYAEADTTGDTSGNPTILIFANDLSNDIILAPNPATNDFRILLNNNESINNVAVYDLSGRLLVRVKTTNNYVGVSSLPPGNYVVKVSTSKQHYIKRLVLLNR